MKTTIAAALVILTATTANATQYVLNPSFENNTATNTIFNMSNAVATATLTNFTAFGNGVRGGGEIDLSTGNGYFGAAQDGDWFVTVHTSDVADGFQDAFSLELSEILATGSLYQLQFFANAGTNNTPNLEIGVSSSASDFGTLVFETTNYSEGINSWTELSTTFESPAAATHLTFRAGFPSSSGASIDNISLRVIVPEPTAALVDIKPGNGENPINLKSKGVLPVAILGTDEFDVTEVDFDSLLFGDPLLLDNGGTAVSPLRSALEDISGDGLLDLTLKFSTADLVEDGALGPDTIEGLLTGLLLDGTPFEDMDSIRIVPPNGTNGDGLQVSAVPEPTTCTLALAACCLAMGRRRTR